MLNSWGYSDVAFVDGGSQIYMCCACEYMSGQHCVARVDLSSSDLTTLHCEHYLKKTDGFGAGFSHSRANCCLLHYPSHPYRDVCFIFIVLLLSLFVGEPISNQQ